MRTINPSVKHHAIIGILLSLWGLLFAFFIRPFEHGDMDTAKWVWVSLGFGFFVFVCYVIVSWIQKWVFTRLSSWNIGLELGFYFVFYALYALMTFFYYRSSIIEGFYDFPEFLSEIIVKIFLVVTPILYVARRYANSLLANDDGLVMLKGENKLDVLKIKRSDLICISNAQNYVEVFYLDHGVLKTKLLRSSLKQMEQDVDFLVRIHRSHLINTSHFKSWVDTKTVALTQMELPVAKNYRERLLSL